MTSRKMAKAILFFVFVKIAPFQGELIYERFHVDSVVVSRYARTTITSVFLNSAEVPQDVSFKVQLPDTAFISNFTMEVNGTIYVGVADEKDKAAAEYKDRKEKGQNVGLVESKGTNIFQINSNTAAKSRSIFVLTYEELITRSLSVYKQIITLNPGSVVQDLMVSVRVVDEQGILRYKGSNFVTHNRVSDKEVQFKYQPSVAEQNDRDSGLSRDVVVEFDVNRPTDKGAGLIIVNDCFFAQFFSPEGVPTIFVDIVFVIDTSASMSGTKIQQARQSLVEIISQLRAEDYFTIVTFSDTVSTWKDSLVSVIEFREQGKAFAAGLSARGSTNFHEALLTGIGILERTNNHDYIQQLVMLSDGEPTAGITDPDIIVSIATRRVSETRISLNMLGFGIDLNLLLLQRLAIGNRGIVKQVFEGKDAAGQLEGFYKSIANPTLHSLKFKFPANTIETISDVNFPVLYEDSEVVVAGRFTDSACVSGGTIPVSVSGMGRSMQQTFTSQVDPAMTTTIVGIKPDTERLLAYLKIQQLLRSLKIAEDSEYIKQQALELAKKYNFVTELTSLIVVQESVLKKVPRENIPQFAVHRESLIPGPFLGSDADTSFRPLQSMSIMSATMSGPSSMHRGAPMASSIMRYSSGQAAYADTSSGPFQSMSIKSAAMSGPSSMHRGAPMASSMMGYGSRKVSGRVQSRGRNSPILHPPQIPSFTEPTTPPINVTLPTLAPTPEPKYAGRIYAAPLPLQPPSLSHRHSSKSAFAPAPQQMTHYSREGDFSEMSQGVTIGGGCLKTFLALYSIYSFTILY